MNFLYLVFLINVLSAETDWSQAKLTSLIKDKLEKTTDSSLDDSESSCQMQVNTEAIMTMKRETSVAYAGNGFTYEIGCSVFDPKIKIGDKYYVIDLIVYGPNTRVAKAWREQFSTATLSATKKLVLNKSLSFHWLGLNNIVCSVSKYNNLANKFTRICQKSTKINVSEKPNDLNVPNQNDLLKIAAVHKQIWSSSSSSSKPTLKPITFKTTEDFFTTSDEFISYEKTNSILLKTLNSLNQTDELVKTGNKSELTNDTLINLSLSAKAMQYRDLNEVSDKKFLSKSSPESIAATKRFIQPLTVILIFLIVFSVSIATLIYSTYHQKPSKEYHAVNVNMDKDCQLDDDINLESIKISNSNSSHLSDSDIQESLNDNDKTNLKQSCSSVDEISAID